MIGKDYGLLVVQGFVSRERLSNAVSVLIQVKTLTAITRPIDTVHPALDASGRKRHRNKSRFLAPRMAVIVKDRALDSNAVLSLASRRLYLTPQLFGVLVCHNSYLRTSLLICQVSLFWFSV